MLDEVGPIQPFYIFLLYICSQNQVYPVDRADSTLTMDLTTDNFSQLKSDSWIWIMFRKTNQDSGYTC